MKTPVSLIAGAVPVFAAGASLAQSGNMMGGDGGGMGWMGGFGGLWLPILLLVVVVGVVAWVVGQRSK